MRSLVVALLALAACGKVVTRAHLGGKRSVDVIETDDIAVGRGGEGLPSFRTVHGCKLAIEGVDVDVWVDCDHHVDLAEDDTGDRVAWRVSGDTWHELRIGSEGRAWLACPPTYWNADRAAFGPLEPLAIVARGIVACAESHQDAVMRSLIDELRARFDEAGAVDLMVELGRSETLAASDDPWPTIETSQPAAVRARIERAACPALLDPATSGRAFVRLAQVCRLDDPRLAAAARDRLGARLAGRGTYADGEATWLAALALRGDVAPLADAACAALGRTEPSDEIFEVAALVLARAPGARCAAVDGHLANARACDRSIWCDGALCTATALADEARAGFPELDGAATGRRWPHLLDGDHLLVAAAYAHGGLPPTFATRTARAAYAYAHGRGRPCTADGLKPGTPCACDAQPDGRDRCALPLDGKWARVGECMLRADDRAEKIIGARVPPAE